MSGMDKNAARSAESEGAGGVTVIATPDGPKEVRLGTSTGASPETAPRPESLEAVRDALVTAKRYMAHLDTCSYTEAWGSPETDYCTCGISAAMRQVNAALAARQGGGERA